MVKIKLELQPLTNIEVAEFSKLVGGKMNLNTTFPSPTVAATALTTNGTNLETLLLQREGLESQLLQLTLQIRSARDKCIGDLNLDATYVEGVINTITPPATQVDPTVAATKAQSAGMDVEDTPTPVGVLPKVENLRTSRGDEDAEIDLQWDPIKRGLNNYILQMSTDPLGLTGYVTIATPTKSKFSVKNLIPGTRYWFTVAANGSAGPGPASDKATKVAQ